MRRLLRWLFSWFKKVAPLALIEDGERLDVYKPVKRLIFSYFNGHEQVQADPMTLYRKLVMQGVDIKQNLQAFHEAQTEADAVNAHMGLVTQVNKAFDLKPYEQGGVTSIETLACWDQFLKFVGFTNKSAPMSLTKPKEEPPQEPPAPSPAPSEPPPPSFNPTALARSAEVNNAPPVVTIELAPEDAAVLTEGTANIPVLQREDNSESGSAAVVQETDGHRAGT